MSSVKNAVSDNQVSWEKIIEKVMTCQICGKKVSIKVLVRDLENAKKLPLAILDVHGDPSHGVVAYFDRDGRIRGQEGLEKLQINNDILKTMFSSILTLDPKFNADMHPKPTILGMSIVRLLFQSIEYLFKSTHFESSILIRKMGIEVGQMLYGQQPKNSLRDALGFIQQYWAANGLGRVQLVQDQFPVMFRVHDCFECSNIPNIGKCFCSFDEGIIEGFLASAVKHHVFAHEEKCPAKGDQYCEFVVESLSN
jgi:predicted hydrocarbon binding protein